MENRTLMTSKIDRRLVVSSLAGLGVSSCARAVESAEAGFGLISQIKSTPGDRKTLIDIIGAATRQMAGCRSYVLAEDLTDPDVIWVTELWESEAAHAESLKTPSVQAAIKKGRAYIAGMTPMAKTSPVFS